MHCMIKRCEIVAFIWRLITGACAVAQNTSVFVSFSVMDACMQTCVGSKIIIKHGTYLGTTGSIWLPVVLLAA